MKPSRFFVYSWHVDDNDEEITSMRLYGLDEENKNVCLRVDDFTPYIYLELPSEITWNKSNFDKLSTKIDDLLKEKKPIRITFASMKKLYGAYLDSNGVRRKYPYVRCAFSSRKDIRVLEFKLRKPIHLSGVGIFKIKMHESDASPELQLSCRRNLPTAGWIQFKGNLVKECNKLTLCDQEYIVRYENLRPYSSDKIAKAKILAFDIEVNSSNPARMPNANVWKDEVFQISCVLTRVGDNPDDYEKFLLTLGEPLQEIVGDDVLIYSYNTEHDLLEGFVGLIRDENPNVIAGYNILGFDIDYMLKRARLKGLSTDYFKQGFHKTAMSKEKQVKWSSSAYKNQEFQYLDAEGRVFVDLLPLVRRDYKLNNYKLKTVSAHFLGETKDPLTVKGIFKCYAIGIKKNSDGEHSGRARKAMGIVGKYCMIDSLLVLRLLDKLQTWIGLSEMANTCQVSMFTLYTQGQQIKVYSQLYKYCMFQDIVVEKNAYEVKESERYVGAHVFPPIPGRHKMVVPFDFASLYPTTIIAYNIDYHTWVPNDSDIPDELCHVMEWEDHIGCTHDPKVVRKLELTNYITTEETKIKKMRENRNKLLISTVMATNKCTKKEAPKIRIKEKERMNIEINRSVRELKVYKEERGELNKSKPKFPMCEKRFYRFLKKPKGILPTIIQNLLDARKRTRKVEMAEHKRQIERLKLLEGDHSEEIKDHNCTSGCT